MGKCESCGEWSTLVEEIVTPEPKIRPSRKEAVGGHPQPIVRVNAAEDVRLQTGVQELDRVLGGGIVPGSVVLLGGDPGIGKSTLMMQVCAHPGGDRPVLFASGEESLKQLKLRADRLHITSERFLVISETDVEEILRAIGEVQP